MKRILQYVFLVVLTHASFKADAQLIDSLRQALLNPSLADSTVVDLYNELAFAYASSNPALGLNYADSALTLAIRIENKRKIANSHNSFGVSYWYLGKDSLALRHYGEVLGIYKEFNDEPGQARMYNNMALLSYNSASYTDALHYHEKANEIFEKHDLTANLINSLSNTGVVFLAIDDYPHALEFFFKALSKTDSTKHQELGNLNTNIGLVYKNLNELNLSAKHHREAIKYQRLAGNDQGAAQAMSNLANVLQLQSSFDEAYELYQSALEINQRIGNERRVASDYANIGVLAKQRGKFADARQYLDAASGIYKSVFDPLNLSFVLLELAEIETLENAGKPNAAHSSLKLQESALAFAQEARSLSRQMAAWEGISKSREKLNQSQLALEAYRNYVALKDSVFNHENDKKLVRIQAAYDMEMRERVLLAEHSFEKQLLESHRAKEALLARVYLMAIVVGIAIVVLVFYLYKRKNKARNDKLLAEFNARKTALELKALRAQMNPHFIFNALSSISNYLLKNDPEKADYYLTRFAKLIRMILDSSDQSDISLSEELEMLAYYVEIESMRMGKPIRFEVSNPEQMDLTRVRVPPMLIQPLVENAIWHGISKVNREGLIEISLVSVTSGISIKVRDNGGGLSKGLTISKESYAERKSMGIQLIQSRLSLLRDKSEQRNDQVSWVELPEGVEVGIELPKVS